MLVWPSESATLQNLGRIVSNDAVLLLFAVFLGSITRSINGNGSRMRNGSKRITHDGCLW